MENSPSWEANKFSAGHKIPYIKWNPRIHYRIHKSQIKPGHTYPTNFLKIHINIALPTAPKSFKWSPSLRSPYQNPVCTSPVSQTCHMTLSSHSSWFDHTNNIYLQQAKCITMTTLVVMTYPRSDDGYWGFCIIHWHWRKRLLCVLLNIPTLCNRACEWKWVLREIYDNPCHMQFFMCVNAKLCYTYRSEK